MGSSPAGSGGGGGSGGSVVGGGGGGAVVGCTNGTSNNSCYNVSRKCRCRWRCLMSSGFVFFLGCFVLFGLAATLYVWFAFTPYYARTALSSSSMLGCQEDNEGSWSVGVFFGDSPFSLKPIEAMNVWRDKTAAWPVANPVVTCASVSDAGFPSNFVADPFLYVRVEKGSLVLMVQQDDTDNM